MTTHTIQTSRTTVRQPRYSWPLARIAQLDQLLLQTADRVDGACAHSIGLGSSSVEACRDKGEMVRGEGVVATSLLNTWR